MSVLDLDHVFFLLIVNIGIAVLWGNRPFVGKILTLLYILEGLSILTSYHVLLSGAVLSSSLTFTVMQQTVQWQLGVSGGFFALITFMAAGLATWFSSGVWARSYAPIRLLHSYMALNVAAMLLLLASNDFLGLFIAWELVSLVSFLIIAINGGRSAKAAYSYILYAFLGAMAILLALIIIWNATNSFSYVEVRHHWSTMSVNRQLIVVLLLITGFGIKMAILPFHRWQAPAYAYVPAPVAAFLGAISSRMGLFALFIVLLQVVGIDVIQTLWLPFEIINMQTFLLWLAALTLIIPTFIALRQTDARLLLAWHGIGQGGFMLLGILSANALGTAGGIMHVFNHASYQAALFFAVFSVSYRTGTADLDRLGGLVTRMPISFTVMLVGIIGLAGLPPMNGFVSKWLIYKALLDEGMPLLFLAAVIGTLGTILSVYKLIHNTFLGQLRLEHENIKEVPWSMSIPMMILASIVFITGYFPGLLLESIAAMQSTLGISVVDYHLGGVNTGKGNLNMIVVVSTMLMAIGMGALIFFVLGNPRKQVTQWDNYAGGHFLTSDMRYQYSHNFYPGLMRVISPLYRNTIFWLESAIVSTVQFMAHISYALFMQANYLLYLILLVVISLLWVLAV